MASGGDASPVREGSNGPARNVNAMRGNAAFSPSLCG